MATPQKPFWSRYILYDYSFSNFSAGIRVVDVGCGRGTQLEQIARRGCRAVGVELNSEALAACAKRRLTVVQGLAEALPFRTGSLGGLICKVVLPYTDETRALGEFARLLAPHGIAYVCSHGAGYYLRYLMAAPAWKQKFYALRAIVNTWLYVALGWRLLGFLGDSVYQTRGRLDRAYRRFGFRVIENTSSPGFCGLPAFIYQRLERAEKPSLTPAAT
jgi:ubiquinone/menaquinone biosynthesis C-methylase UbiE